MRRRHDDRNGDRNARVHGRSDERLRTAAGRAGDPDFFRVHVRKRHEPVNRPDRLKRLDRAGDLVVVVDVKERRFLLTPREHRVRENDRTHAGQDGRADLLVLTETPHFPVTVRTKNRRVLSIRQRLVEASVHEVAGQDFQRDVPHRVAVVRALFAQPRVQNVTRNRVQIELFGDGRAQGFHAFFPEFPVGVLSQKPVQMGFRFAFGANVVLRDDDLERFFVHLLKTQVQRREHVRQTELRIVPEFPRRHHDFFLEVRLHRIRVRDFDLRVLFHFGDQITERNHELGFIFVEVFRGIPLSVCRRGEEKRSKKNKKAQNGQGGSAFHRFSFGS